MARELKLVKMLLSNVDEGVPDPDFDEIRVEYQITDGDLHAYKAWVVSGIDTNQSLSDFWNEVITTVSGMEGI